MLNFEPEHSTIIVNKPQKKISHRTLVVAGLIISVTLLAGCAEIVDCDIEGLHAHNYTSSSSFDRYIISEKDFIDTFDARYYRTSEYISIDEKTKELIEFEKKHNLFRISDNKDIIYELVSSQNDFILYEYEYSYVQTIPRYIKVGKTLVYRPIYITKTATALTNAPNKKDLTGNEKTAHYLYCGYKIVKNEKGKLKVVQSEYVNSLEELLPEYIYVKPIFYKVVDLESLEELDYVDDLNRDKTIKDIKNLQTNQEHNSKRRRKIK